MGLELVTEYDKRGDTCPHASHRLLGQVWGTTSGSSLGSVMF